MSSDDPGETQPSFPTYAALSQTQAWNTPAPHVQIDRSDIVETVEISHGSRYNEGPLLGKGGMGKVILARDQRIGRDVAVKVLHPERELEPEERARFLREAQVQGQLEHPAIVPVYDIERREDGTTFFTMRRVHGRTLGEILEDLRTGVPSSVGRYTQHELLTAFATVCLAVDYAHTRGVVHRDLKPANVMLGDFGEVYVLDWGLARLIGEVSIDATPAGRLSLPGTMLGTPLYMAPEQMADPDVGPAADVYSLGLMLFELLTLQRARDPSAIFMPVDARATVRAPQRNIAPELETICVKATMPDPAERFASARALQEALARYLDGDRELARRKELATQHADAARAAIKQWRERGAGDDAERERAVTDLGRAVALDPTNTEHFTMLGELVSAIPSQVPPEVATRLDADEQDVVRLAARFAIGAMLSWFLFLPFMWWSGFADAKQLALIVTPVTIAVIINAILNKRRRIGAFGQYAAIAAMVAAGASTSRLLGPFVIVPTIAATFAIALQAHPNQRRATVGAFAAIIAFLVPVALEWAQLVPTSYLFADGRLTIQPQLLELPRTQTFTYLVLVNLSMILGPVMLIRRVRADLSAAQTKLAIQAWHFERLGASLIGVPKRA